mmetsp:Transcript_23828/g.58432  ORF Transcript_23828/g.58432 Transcript_23828/m.58432 type:complete len:158 (+) Transcript_23828:175-648(+)
MHRRDTMPSVVARLIAAGADVNKTRSGDGVAPLHLAAQNGYSEIVELLVAAGADVNTASARGNTALYAATVKRCLEVAKLAKCLIAAGADVNKARPHKGSAPLLFAARDGYGEPVELLIAAGADVNKALPCGATPLSLALTRGHAEVVRMLRAAGAT